jgi:hypothetical protein
MKLISALLQESISGLFTNSTKDMEARDYQVFKKGYQMLGGEVHPEKDSEVGKTGEMVHYKFTPSLRDGEYGHFAFDNVSLLDLLKQGLSSDTDIRRRIAKEFNISPDAPGFERQVLIAADNHAPDIIRRLGYHKEITL